MYDADAGLDVIIARCFSFVGRDLPIDAHFAIGNFIRDALYEEAIYVNGDGKPLRSYMDQDDLARWLLEILQRGRTGQAYNVGSDEVLTISELAHLVRDIVAPEKSVIILGEGESGGDRNRYIPDISKAQYELKLELRKPLSESIRTLADVHRRGG